MSQVLLYRSLVQVVITISLSLLLGCDGLVIGLVCGSIFQYTFGTVLLRDIYLNSIDPYPLKSLLKESWSFYLESYLMYARSEGDIIIVTAFLGTESLAIYFVAKKVLVGISSIYESLNSVLVTRLSTFRDNYKKFSEEAFLFLKLQAFTLLPLTVIFLVVVPWLILVLGGPEYSESILPGMLLASTPFLMYIFVLSYNAIIFLFMPSTSRLYLTLVNTIILLTSLLLLSMLFSVIGIALARLLTALFTGIFAIAYVRYKKIHLSFPIKDFLKMFLILVVSFGYLIFYQVSYTPQFQVSAILFIGGIILFFSLISLILSNDFYNTLNKISPIKLSDPVKFILHEVRRARHA